MQINVAVTDANNIVCQVVPPQTEVITIDRGVAGNGIVSIVPVTISTFQYLRITYTNGTVQDVGPLTSTAYTATSPITIVGNTISLATVPIASGGTDATTAAGAIQNLLPSYTGNANKRLGLNSGGTGLEWVADGGGTVTSIAASGGSTGLTFSGSPITSSGTLTLGGTLAVASGGTGATTAADARTNLSAAFNAITISAGTGLTGGGDLTANRTLSIDSSVVTLTGTQTLTNKTLTSPKINEILDTNGNEILGLSPTASATDFVTIKNGIGVGVPLHIYADGSSASIGLHIQPKGTGLVTISDGTDFNKGIRFRSSGSAASAVTLLDAVSTAGRVVTLPDATTTLVGRDTTDTLTNKTIAFASNTFTGALSIANGGTGQTTANAALNALLPTQTGNASKYLQTDGTNATWDAISLSTADITGILPTANGGTGLSSFTANGVVYASSTSALTTGSALTFDGTNFGIGGASSGVRLDVYGSINARSGTIAADKYTNYGTNLTLDSGGSLPMLFQLNGSEQMRLTSTGLGIGTSSPAYKLDVAGSVRSTGTILIDSAAGATQTALQVNDTATNGYTAIKTTSDGNGNGVLGLYFQNTETIHLAGWSGDYSYFNAGNVGIGTSSPTKKLDIRGTNAGELALIQINNDSISGSPTIATMEFACLGSAKASIAAAVYADGYMAFRTNNNTEKARITASGELLIGRTSSSGLGQIQSTIGADLATDSGSVYLVRGGGNVGINTSSPSYKLHVAATAVTAGYFTSSAAATTLTIDNSNANAWGGNLAIATQGTTAGYFGTIGSLLGTTSQDLSVWATAGNGFRVYTNGNNERMRVTSAGDVGIGTTTPDIFGRFYTRSVGISSSGTTALQINGSTYGTIDLGAGGTRTTSITGSSSEAQFATVTAIPILFTTNSVERARINSSGSLGINTTAPAGRLQINALSGSPLLYVNGTTYSYDSSSSIILTESNTSAQTGINALMLANNTYSVGAYSPILSFTSRSSSGSYNNVYAGIYGVLTGEGVDTNWVRGDLVLATDQGAGITERVRIKGSGNSTDGFVGIGTSSPSAKLHVSNGTTTNAIASNAVAGFTSSANSVLSFNVPDANAAGLFFGYGGNAYWAGIEKSGSTGLRLVSGGIVQFDTNGSERARIDSSGNFLLGNSANNGVIGLRSTGTLYIGGGNSNTSEIILQTGSSERARIDSNGYFGIGTSSPTATLEVSGAVGVATAIFKVGTNGNGGIVWRNAANASVGYIQVNSDNVQYASTNDGSGAYLQKSGITFPATQSASSNANTLDDYEEGSWTPSLTFTGGSTGMTYSVRTGSYTKIGRMVYFNCRVTLTNKGSSTGYAQIQGLPFAVSSDTSTNYSGAYLCYGNGLSGWNVTLQITLDQGQSYLFLRFNNGSNNVEFNESNFTNSSDVIFTGCYQANT
jgi:trimeric autotransporter adhesin